MLLHVKNYHMVQIIHLRMLCGIAGTQVPWGDLRFSVYINLCSCACFIHKKQITLLSILIHKYQRNVSIEGINATE